ncbi:MAG TPA: hypothetical protein VHF28_07780 [Nitrososphaera sp.]|nr:hypothetical protein [Nitrososphaera sp.]
MSSTERNYTNAKQPVFDSKTERVGDITGEPPTNEAVDHNKAAKMANLLEGLEFPATKEKIRNHLNAKSPSKRNRINNDVVEAIENNLDENREYASAYDIEIAAGLVVKREEGEKSHSKDSELNRDNSERTGEAERQDPHSNHERISSASSKDVSPNTPKGESV